MPISGDLEQFVALTSGSTAEYMTMLRDACKIPTYTGAMLYQTN